MDGEKQAFNHWWNGICRQGDPLRRPNLSREAFRAGYATGQAATPPIAAPADAERWRQLLEPIADIAAFYDGTLHTDADVVISFSGMTKHFHLTVGHCRRIRESLRTTAPEPQKQEK